MLALLRFLLLPVRLPFLLLRLLQGVSVFVSCVVPLIVAVAIAGGIAWFVFVR
ncbi:MAG: hypothetical protein OYI31_05360 [Chloroflexota bacterium]|nr:hypothetical protein [Chloroflexota bacterium]MDE2942452.1 hypothetical protein [Chloroflexota bacterium]MDE3267868.1 hypothetical protein [Chloroflexota bacterium]